MVNRSSVTILDCNQLSDLPSLANDMLLIGDGLKVWLFEGELGSGKTTLIKSICRILGSKDEITSPTFSLINEYLDGFDKELFHFDFYRIEKEQEAYQIGCEEYFYSGSYCFIEWPSKIPSLIPEEHLEINIKVGQDGLRKFDLKRHD